ncbi:polyisoprenoid-binding protein [Sphaerotilus montanus]|uniref:Polyisoprenoid-binding protein YceI n=1 Tax=Sphaerotilus montanus TaxID=522889 RepID=A0A7Y9QY58_9BURK|nr:YceI family protein [Sphaerotilus montanus]NYG32779.1 polyisoprenoid-binding protein YceI [Sphaerotilus montanus]NZD56831.1 polyisoprenoid-binding protein [Sphaerotilus montanus]
MKKTLLALALVPVLFASAAQAQSATYAIEPTHTFVTFEIDHFGTSTNRGRFDKKEGTVQFDRAGKSGKVDITIDTTSINTGTAPFDGHLKSAEILNVAAHPTARFVSDKFVFEGDKVKEVTGQFTLMGKTNPVTLKATKFNCYMSPIIKREVCGGDFEATIKRSQWGASYGINYGFSDDMRLVVQVEAVKQ